MMKSSLPRIAAAGARLMSARSVISAFVILGLLSGVLCFAGADIYKAGDVVELIQDQPLYLKEIAMKAGRKGDLLTVILQREDKVYVASTDASGRKIALSVSVNVVRRPSVPASGNTEANATFHKATPEEATYLVTTDAGKGSAFLAQMNGAVYLVTNFHVVEGARKIQCSNRKDKFVISDGTIEVAADRDLVRFPIQKDFGLTITNSEKIEDPVAAYGNSGGQDVVTKLDGKVLGMGPTEVEVSCEFIPGNSGGPIATPEGAVVGLSTYVKRDSDVPDWIKKGTRFSATRRFGVRISDDIVWSAVPLPVFQAQSAITVQESDLFDELLKFAQGLCNEPFREKMETNFSDYEEIANLVSTYNSACKEYNNTVGSSVTPSELNAINSKFRGRLHSHSSSLIRSIRSMAQTMSFKAKNVTTPFIRKRSNEILKDMGDLADYLDKNVQEISSTSLFSYTRK